MTSQNADESMDIRHIEVLNTPIRKVWEAVATSAGIAVWFMPNNFEPVVGHEFYLDAGPLWQGALHGAEDPASLSPLLPVDR